MMNNMYKILETLDSLMPVQEAKSVDPELQRIAHNYPREVKQLLSTGDFDKDLYSALFDYYNNAGEMPYGVAKARDGDPYEWIFQRFTDDMGTESPLSGVGADAGLGLNKAMQGVEEEIRTYGAVGGPGSGYGGMTESEELDEKWGTATKVSPEEKGKYAGKTKAELLKSYNALKASGPHAKGSKEYSRMKELAFAIRAKSGWGKVAETVTEGKKAKPDFLDLDKDGNKKEPMKKAAKEKQVDEAKGDDWDFSDLPKEPTTRKIAGKRYGGSAQVDEPEDDDDDSKPAVKKGRGRPAGSKRAIGAKGPTGKSKLLKKGAIREEEFNIEEAIARLEEAGYTVSEKAPPGAKAERMVKHIKKSLSKDGHLSDKDKAIAYATTWKAKKAGKVEEDGVEEGSTGDYSAKKARAGKDIGKPGKQFAKIAKSAAEKYGSKERGEKVAGAVLAKLRGKNESVETDDKAERAGRRVAKDIEYDEGNKSKGDNKAERAGKKVTKDIEYDELHELSSDTLKSYRDKAGSDIAKQFNKKDDEKLSKRLQGVGKASQKLAGVKPKKVKETTVAGSVAPSVAAPDKAAAGGYQFGKGVYEGINTQVEKMITESMSINVNVDSNGQKSINVSATDEDADKLAEILKMAGIGSMAGGMQEAKVCETCGQAQCECAVMGESEELANSPDEEYADTDMMTQKLAGGLNKPKTTVAGDGQTTIPVTAVQVKESQEVSKIENSLWNLFKTFKK